MKKNMIAIIIIVGLIAYGGYDYFSKSSSKMESTTLKSEVTNLDIGIERGQLAPDFLLNDLEGNPVLLSDYKGKTVLLNFWATWCPPCRVEMPHMQKFYQDYESKDVVILGVNMTPSEERLDVVGSFVEKQGLTFPILLDEEANVVTTYQVVAYPTTYIIDADGVVRDKYRGAINYDIMKDAVEEIK